MGTRHLQTLINKKGVVKIRQYGQWDGYPSGQGKDILEYLRTGDLEKYQLHLSKIKKINTEQRAKVEKDKEWTKNYPYLSRDCGSRIHKMIEDDTVKFVVLTSQEEADQWCEGFYTIDFSKNEFTSTFYGVTKTYKLDNLPTDEEYLNDMRNNEEDEE